MKAESDPSLPCPDISQPKLVDQLPASSAALSQDLLSRTPDSCQDWRSEVLLVLPSLFLGARSCLLPSKQLDPVFSNDLYPNTTLFRLWLNPSLTLTWSLHTSSGLADLGHSWHLGPGISTLSSLQLSPPSGSDLRRGLPASLRVKSVQDSPSCLALPMPLNWDGPCRYLFGLINFLPIPFRRKE